MLKALSFFMALSLVCCPFSLVWSQNTGENTPPPVRVVEPDKKTDSARAAIRDTERYEFGIYTGLLSVEDFNTNPLLGFAFVYHVNDNLFAQVNYGSSKVSRATFEDVADQNFLSSGDRRFNYLTLSGAWQIMHGRSYYRTTGKYNSGFYLTAGLGNVEFAGNSELDIVVGASYRIIRTDWLALNFDYRNHIFSREFIGDDKQTMNNEFVLGFNFFF